ncbi:MAG: glutamate-5-semialdehyde dehydrogenase [Pontimonas sp.]|nr:glutamate-5-semialdehyde dehydrogenase [Pontimonas sp.]
MTGPTSTIAPALRERLDRSKNAAGALTKASSSVRDDGLAAIQESLRSHVSQIVEANALDLERGAAEGMESSLQDRLRLTPERVQGLVDAVGVVRSLPDPVGDVIRGMTLPNGLQVSQVRVPFGVVGAIYEARPNVTVDIAALALKSGNAVVLRGGSAALESNKLLVTLMRDALASVGLPADSIATVDDFGREGAEAMMKGRGYIDVLIPRGSAALIETVVTESTVPVIETGSGIVHIFVDASASGGDAPDIIHNAKVQRPSVCNSVETVLVHRDALGLVPAIAERLLASGVTLHADETIRAIVPDALSATEQDWATEYLSLDLSLKTVDSLDEALDHIRRYSTHHTESILTADMANAERFLNEVDSAAVIVNASTRFTDGGEFGFGAEVGISTQKLHARGPMGLPELTSTKWIIRGQGQIRD